jgi:ring-1,2-phenylacetyl-CoA epoxidase subunit PaaD
VEAVEVRWRKDVSWSPARISARARQVLAEEMTVAVPGPGGAVRCPVCGQAGVRAVSEFGPSPCRRVARCSACRNPVEVVRG